MDKRNNELKYIEENLMQQENIQSELTNLIKLIPASETNTVKTFIEFVIKRNTIIKQKKERSVVGKFEKFVKYCEERPEGKPLSKKGKKTVENSLAEREKGEYYTLAGLKKLQKEKKK
jgi:hypothetical protein